MNGRGECRGFKWSPFDIVLCGLGFLNYVKLGVLHVIKLCACENLISTPIG